MNHTLPDGSSTNDQQEFNKKWDELFSALEGKYGLVVTSFSPDVCVYAKDDSCSVTTIPMWLARKMIAK